MKSPSCMKDDLPHKMSNPVTKAMKLYTAAEWWQEQENELHHTVSYYQDGTAENIFLFLHWI